MAVTRIFRSGNGLAVRLPEGTAAKEGDEVEIVCSGDVLTLTPARSPGPRLSMAEFIEGLKALPLPDKPLARDPFEAPLRAGLDD